MAAIRHANLSCGTRNATSQRYTISSITHNLTDEKVRFTDYYSYILIRGQIAGYWKPASCRAIRTMYNKFILINNLFS